MVDIQFWDRTLMVCGMGKIIDARVFLRHINYIQCWGISLSLYSRAYFLVFLVEEVILWLDFWLWG